MHFASAETDIRQFRDMVGFFRKTLKMASLRNELNEDMIKRRDR